MKRILILGGGFGGAYCAQALERKLLQNAEDPSVEIVLIDQNNYFVFYPLLLEAGTGSLEPRHAVVSLRAFLTKTTLIMGSVIGLDAENSRVTYQRVGSQKQEIINYDHAVIALGSVTRIPPVPGLAEFGFQLKSLSDAVALRDRAIALLEQANGVSEPKERQKLLHFVFVGGNYTGVEAAGEFDVLLSQARKQYPLVKAEDCRITLVERNNHILPTLERELADYALEQMRRRSINVILETSAARVFEEGVLLTNSDTLLASTVVWCAGIAPNPVLSTFSLPKNEQGYIMCEPDLRVRDYSNLWAIGDCAVNPDADGQAYPATAQHAVRQGEHAAANIASVLKGKPSRPCVLNKRGTLAALGCRTGVAEVFGVKLSGFPAWFLWRSVYLLKMPGLGRKLRIALDWTADLLFRRDYVSLGVHRRPMFAAKTGAQSPVNDGTAVLDSAGMERKNPVQTEDPLVHERIDA